jgi:hypothetical protein
MIALLLLLQAAPAPTEACAPGVYLEGGVAEAPTPIHEKLTDHRKMSGIVGFALLGGFTPLKVKTVLPGKAAAVRTHAQRPAFIFCEPPEPAAEPEPGGQMGYVGVSAAGYSPLEFRLVRFDVEGDQREVPLSAMSVTGPKAGAVQNATVRFEATEIAPGQFRVVPAADLAAGEYGFLKTSGNTPAANGKKAPPERVFDFAVE